jgi:hypothetical protein
MNIFTFSRGLNLAARPAVIVVTALVVSIATGSVRAADGPATNGPAAAPAKRLSKTVGLDIVKKTVNPDQTVSLTFHWKEKGNESERTVVLNDKTIVVFNGKLVKFADLSEQNLHVKAVATVGSDDVTAVLLRFGKAPLPKDKLTDAQRAMLASLAPAPTAASNTALDSHVVGIVASLQLADPAKEARLRGVLEENLRAVRDAHNAGLQLDPSFHQKLIAGLQAELTPDQVESVKDKLTANKVPITYKTYQAILPSLKDEDKAKILALLKEAREKSLDQKNVDEMSPIFKGYKTEIERYLNSHGYDWAASYKTYVDAQKAEPAHAKNN